MNYMREQLRLLIGDDDLMPLLYVAVRPGDNKIVIVAPGPIVEAAMVRPEFTVQLFAGLAVGFQEMVLRQQAMVDSGHEPPSQG